MLAGHVATSSRKSSYQRGRDAEHSARCLLQAKNYRVIAERYRNEAGEIDLVAVRGDHVAFIEVKGRKSQLDAAFAVQPRQQRRIARAAEGFLAQNAELSHCSASFDVILVSPREGCTHIEHAFMAE